MAYDAKRTHINTLITRGCRYVIIRNGRPIVPDGKINRDVILLVVGRSGWSPFPMISYSQSTTDTRITERECSLTPCRYPQKRLGLACRVAVVVSWWWWLSWARRRVDRARRLSETESSLSLNQPRRAATTLWLCPTTNRRYRFA